MNMIISKRGICAAVLSAAVAVSCLHTGITILHASEPYNKPYKDEVMSGNYIKITVKKPVDFNVKNDKDQRIVVSAFGRGKFAGYDVRFRSGTREWKTYRVLTTSNLRHKFVGLNKDWQYQVQVRAVRKIKETYYPSRWTKKKVVTIKN